MNDTRMTVDGAQKVPIEGCLVAGRMHPVSTDKEDLPCHRSYLEEPEGLEEESKHAGLVLSAGLGPVRTPTTRALQTLGTGAARR
jgi:hypothetical protein